MDVPLTPLHFLERAQRLFPDRVGVVDGDRRFTYGDFARRSQGLARALSERWGVQPGDRVAWLGPNTHHLLEAYYGVLLAGAVLVPLNIRLGQTELEGVLADCAPALLVRHPEEAEPRHGGSTAVLGPEFEKAVTAPGEPLPPPRLAETDPAEIFYTSGSTGSPKGAVLSHRALYLHAVDSALTLGITGEDVILHTIPLFHVNGWGTPHYLTALGGVHVVLARFDGAEVLRLIEGERVTRLFLVPTMAQRIVAARAAGGDRDISSLRQVSIGGAPASPELVGAVEDVLGCECICGYGMTETAPQLTKSLDKPGEPPERARRATTGLPIIGVDLRVMAGDGQEVRWDGETVGEITVRSPHVMDGYWNDPEATSEVIRGGRLWTGDLAVVRPDGYVVIVDRRKDLIVSGGENVASPEVERCLLRHPDVAEAAVVGVPDPEWGEVPHAFVAPEPGATVDPQELVEWCRRHLARFKVPREVTLVPELPKGGTGKVHKHVLRARWAGEGSGEEAGSISRGVPGGDRRASPPAPWRPS